MGTVTINTSQVTIITILFLSACMSQNQDVLSMEVNMMEIVLLLNKGAQN